MSFRNFVKSLSGWLIWERNHCLFYELQKKIFEQGEMALAEEKWDKTWGELGQMSLSCPGVKIAIDSVVAGPEAPRRVQKGPDTVVSV